MGNKAKGKNKNKKRTEAEEWPGKIKPDHTMRETTVWAVYANQARAYGDPGKKAANHNLKPTWKDCVLLADKEIDSMMRKNFLAWKRLGENKIILEGILADRLIPPELRFVQPVKLFQVVPPGKVGKIKKDFIDGVSNSSINRGGVGSQLGFRCHGFAIPTLHYMLYGARYWIIIKHSGSNKLQELVAAKKGKPTRYGCIQGEYPILSLTNLENYGIEYETVVQRNTETVLMFPGVHYAYINLHEGTTVIVSHFPTETWFEHAYVLHKCEPNHPCPCDRPYELDYEKIKKYEEKKKKHGVNRGSVSMLPQVQVKTAGAGKQEDKACDKIGYVEHLKTLHKECEELLIEKRAVRQKIREETEKLLAQKELELQKLLDEQARKYQKEFEKMRDDQRFKRRKLDPEMPEDRHRPSVDEMLLEMSLRESSDSESDSEQ